MADLQSRLIEAFVAKFGQQPDVIARAPGRVNLIGEHTDYNDGFVLPMAIPCQTMVAARARADAVIRILAVDLKAALSCFYIGGEIFPDADAPWSNYARGVAHALYKGGLPRVGADIAIAGDIPRGAGLSSSASLEVAFGMALAALGGEAEIDRTALALAGQQAEQVFAGCNCGIMDQLTVARATADHALMIDCRNLETQPVAMPQNTSVIIVHSGIERGLVDGAYNERRAQCEAAARHYGVNALRDLTVDALLQDRAGLEEKCYRRAAHVVSENARVVNAAEALKQGELEALGVLMAESHASMRDDFEITLPAIDDLAAQLQRAIGPMGGARMTGGGFGGAVVAILPSALQAAVVAQIGARYRTPEGDPPHIMVATAAAGVSLILGGRIS